MIYRSAFLKDCNGEKAELFLEVRDYIKIVIGNDVKEKQNSKSTSYKTNDGVFCSIKVEHATVIINWLQGSFFSDKYNFLEGINKKSRTQRIEILDTKAREMIRYYVQETFVFLFEKNGLKSMNQIKYRKSYKSNI